MKIKINFNYNIFINPIFGILSALIGLLGDFLSFLFFENYNMFSNYVSELGVSEGGLFFNLSIIFSGIIVIPFFLKFISVLSNEGIMEDLKRVAFVFSMISVSFFIMIGIFPSDPSIPLSFTLHGIVAFITWLTGMVYLTLFGIMMIIDPRYNGLLSLTTFGQIILIFLFLITWQPLIEWIATFGTVFFLIANSIYMIYKKL
jgi:hypothetical membrane protein